MIASVAELSCALGQDRWPKAPRNYFRWSDS